MRKNKRFLAMLLVMTLALAACAPAAQAPAPAPAAPAPAAAAPAPAPAAAADDDADDDGDLIQMSIHLLGITDDQIAAHVAAGDLDDPSPTYYRLMREGIEAIPGIQVTFEDWGWAETLDTRQRTMIAAGDIPHIVGGEIFMPAYANEGILYPLPPDIVDMVVDSFLIRDLNGIPVAVAGAASVFVLIYNRDLLEAAGFDRAPTTWDEWQDMSDRITAVGNGDFWGGGVPSFPHAGGALRATPFFRQLGTDFFHNGQLQLDNPDLHRALQFIRDMDRNLPPGLGNLTDEGPMWNAFEVDQVLAFAVNGLWGVAAAERNGMNWGVAPLPMPAGGVEGNCLVGATFYGVPRNAPHPDISFEMIRIMLSEEVQIHNFGRGRATPLRSLQARRYLFEDDVAMAVAMDAVASGDFSTLASFPRNDAQIWELINTQVLARTTMTDTPIEEITSDAQRQIDLLLQ